MGAPCSPRPKAAGGPAMTATRRTAVRSTWRWTRWGICWPCWGFVLGLRAAAAPLGGGAILPAAGAVPALGPWLRTSAGEAGRFALRRVRLPDARQSRQPASRHMKCITDSRPRHLFCPRFCAYTDLPCVLSRPAYQQNPLPQKSQRSCRHTSKRYRACYELPISTRCWRPLTVTSPPSRTKAARRGIGLAAHRVPHRTTHPPIRPQFYRHLAPTY